MSNFINIRSGSENKAHGVMTKVNVAVSSNPLDALVSASGSTTRDIPVGDRIQRIDIQPGTYKEPADVNYAVKDRTVSNPSGYNANRVPNWGDGKIARTTVWPTDNEKTNGGAYTYKKAASTVSNDYKNLST